MTRGVSYSLVYRKLRVRVPVRVARWYFRKFILPTSEEFETFLVETEKFVTDHPDVSIDMTVGKPCGYRHDGWKSLWH